MEKRNLNLKRTPVQEARTLFMKEARTLTAPQCEEIPVMEALGRVTWEEVRSRVASPQYDAAAMDGIAVRSADTLGASEASPVILQPEQYVQINTGNHVQAPYDAVIMAEMVQELADGRVRITLPAAFGKHVRKEGEDISEGELLLPEAHRIRAVDIGVLLSAGIYTLRVVKKPRIAVFPTGTELVEPEELIRTGGRLDPGKIIESNSRMFENLIREQGGEARRFPPLPDEYEGIRETILSAAEEFDVIVTNAGTSAGLKDYMVHVLRDLGTVLVHGVAVRPGKPCILAVVKGTPVVGLPGYPVAAYVSFMNFVSPLLEYLGKARLPMAETVKARISGALSSKKGYQEYVRVRLIQREDGLWAESLAHGAGTALSLVRTDGFCVIPPETEQVEAGTEVEILLDPLLNRSYGQK